MTNEQIKLVQDSFRQVAPIAETAAQLFYARLFELDPDLELLFKGNLSEQGRKLMQMLGLAVNSLDRMDHLLPSCDRSAPDTLAMGFATTTTTPSGGRFCGRCGKAWARLSHLMSKQPGVTFTPRSHRQCKVGRKRRLPPLLFSPRRYDSCHSFRNTKNVFVE